MNPQNNNRFRIWPIISPFILYYGIMIVVALFSSMYLAIRLIGGSTATTDVQLMDEVINYALKMTIPMNTITCAVCIPLLWLMRRRDLSLTETEAERKGWDPALLLCLAAGAAAGLASDLFLTLIDAGSADAGYETVNETILSAPVWLQIIGVGILAPAAEELLYRGLLFARLRRWMTWLSAALISAAVFGFIHGNLIQGAYGFMMGFLLAWLMERYKSLLAPILCHIGVNMASLILSLINPVINSRPMLMGGCIFCLALLCFLVNQIHRMEM